MNEIANRHQDQTNDSERRNDDSLEFVLDGQRRLQIQYWKMRWKVFAKFEPQTEKCHDPPNESREYHAQSVRNKLAIESLANNDIRRIADDQYDGKQI